MRKLKLLMAVCAMLFGVSTYAQEWTAASLAEGKYYLQNVGSELFWGAGNDWGTRGSLVKHPEFVTLHLADGKYTMETQVSNGGTNYYFGGDYMDGAAAQLTIETNGSVYSVANGEKYLGYDGSSTILGKDADRASANGQWKIISEAEMLASLASATPAATVDATFLIIDANFGRNNRYVSAWSMDAENKNLSGGNNINNCAESFHSTFTLSQVLSSAPKGLYSLKAQGFYRQDGSDTDYPYFYANTEKCTFPVKTGSENSMSTASESFTAGKYTIDPIFVEVASEGDLTIGAKLESNTALWCIWDNFELTYYGDVTYAEAELVLLKGQYEEKYKEADALKSQPMNGTVMDELTTALTTYETVAENKSDLETAIAALTTVITKASASAAIYAKANISEYLAKMDEGLLGANMYTPEAYATYYTNVQATYDSRTASDDFINLLTANGAFSTGWHAANHLDDILLSSWKIDDVQCKDYTSALYINTWSVEGNTDGSAFYAPFYEYFVGDPNELEAKTFVSTVPGLDANTDYAVTIRARVRRSQTDGIEVDPNAITMQVGSGDVAYLSSGEKFSNTDFYIGNFAAVGKTDASGNLVTTITVAANSGCHWLSFNTMKYQSMAELQAEFDKLKLEAEGLLVNSDYASITGIERTKLSTAKDASTSTFDELTAAINALKDALDAFKPAKAGYDALAAELAKAEEIGMTDSELATYKAIDNATDAAAAVNNLRVDEFEFIETNYPYAVELGAWTTTGSTGTMTGQHWDGTSTSTYLEQSSAAGQGWNANSWDLSYTQELTLPAGKYVFKVAGRHANSNNVQLNLNVIDKEDDSSYGFINDFPYGDTGLGINKEGKASFDPEDPAGFANDNKGRGFQWRYVCFELDEQRTVTLIVSASANALHQWVSFCNPTVQGQDELTKASMNITAANQYATFIAPFKVTIPEGVTASKITGVESNGSTLKLEALKKSIPANTPVLVNSEEAVNQTFVGVNGASEETYTEGLLTGVYEETDAPAGSYVLHNQNKLVGFYKVDTEKATPKVPANRAYLTAPAGSVRAFFLDGEATGIMAVSDTVSGNAEIFNANGMRVPTLQKGLNIVKKDGQVRKIMVK